MHDRETELMKSQHDGCLKKGLKMTGPVDSPK